MKRLLQSCAAWVGCSATISKAFIVLVGGAAFLGATVASETPERPSLSLEELVAARTAVERVYWSHRIWPDVNKVAKPPLAEVLPPSLVRKRVEDDLRKARALEAIWGERLSGRDLQAEIDRMARGTKDPAFLAELWAALRNDPVRVAEVLARPAIVERRIRELFAADRRLHEDLRATASRAVSSNHRGVDGLKGLGGQYTELRYRLDEGSKPRGASIALQPAEWSRLQADLAKKWRGRGNAPSRSVSGLIEDDDGFRVIAILSRDTSSMRIASVSWPKQSFDSWWNAERGSFAPTPGVAASGLSLPTLDAVASCVQDTWTRMDPDMPGSRSLHSAVWTGSELIIWGGAGDNVLQDGWKYDPASDTWSRISSVGAPQGRSQHLATWTGSRMLIEAGYTTGGPTESAGGRYDPTTDTWAPMSTLNRPPLIYGAEAAWSGSEWLLWGGSDNKGGRYDPVTDTWTSMSTVNAPTARYAHSAVWTGNRFVVWGGIDAYSGIEVNTGGVYNPTSNTWAPSRQNTAPSPRAFHTAVWSGSEMIVWGGRAEYPADGIATDYSNGKRYDPTNNQWQTMTTTGALSSRARHKAVWTGSRLLVWGGFSSQGGVGVFLQDGARYDPAGDSWQSISLTGAPRGREYFTANWTGSEMIVWGGEGDYEILDSGGRYNPATDSWSATRDTSHRPPARFDHSAVWTGAEMIVIGGWTAEHDVGGDLDAFRYDPATDDWTSIPRTSLGTLRWRSSAVWTGTQVIVFGGRWFDVSAGENREISQGLAFNPTTGSWTGLSPSGEPAPRVNHSAVWTGDAMIVWGGDQEPGGEDPGVPTVFFADGAAYRPATDTWWPIESSGAPAARSHQATAWTGREMIVWGGQVDPAHQTATGGRYDPAANSWTAMDNAGAPAERASPVAVWDGAEMVVWGGWSYGGAPPDAGRFDPVSNAWRPMSLQGGPSVNTTTEIGAFLCGRAMAWPYPINESTPDTLRAYDPGTDSWASRTSLDEFMRRAFPLVIADNRMIVWGGHGSWNSSDSGAIYCACASPPIPGAPRLFLAKIGVDTRVSWDAMPHTLQYDLVRGRLADLRISGGNFALATSGCAANDDALTWSDDAVPPETGGNWYLVRAVGASGSGTYDDGSTSQIGGRDTEIAASGVACP